MASDKIDFTPVATKLIPLPVPAIFTASNINKAGDQKFFLRRIPKKRSVETVNIPFTDNSYIRDTGLVANSTYIVHGINSYITHALATIDFDILESMEGAICAITTADWDNPIDLVCIDLGDPILEPCFDPGFFFEYTIIFTVETT